jgi:high-affinity iron transporter
MFATAIIVFREVVEAALIISIVVASCRGIAGRGIWVTIGIVAGLAGALVVATFAGAIAGAVSGMGQEIFNACVLFAAVLMLAWHNIWMASHGRQLAKEVGAVGHDVSIGAKPLYAVAVVTGLAVLREGSETALFIYGIMMSGGETSLSLLAGGATGLVAGVALGVLLYFGLLSIPIGRLFTVTNWMLLAAGLAAQGAGFLAQADLLPSLGNELWDTSSFLSDTSVLGRILHTLTGYVAQPSGIQLVFYVTTLIVITVLMQTIGKRTRKPKTA